MWNADPVARVKLQVIDVGFAPWDTVVSPSFSLVPYSLVHPNRGTAALVMTFVDVYGRLVSVRFEGVVAVTWQDAWEEYSDGERTDRCYQVLGSAWLARNKEESGYANLRHLKLNFNAAGVLEVLCTEMPVVTRRDSSEEGDQTTQRGPQDDADRALAVLERAAIREARLGR